VACHRAWRTTRREDAKEVVQALAGVVRRSGTGFRESVPNLLGQAEQVVLGGVLTGVAEKG
jgi:hypothetical protein